ncbi:hypothetical protein SORDD24_01556 [Streptococcus oralis]|uniref:Uncharacterized protein n=1 Tax=Streptococcus oralis TaxID=1303 RepID=A0A139QMB2_STROR|nr:hypothetical protein SORDD24_01556 [Streptococcus oralis]
MLKISVSFSSIERLKMYLLELYQNDYFKNLVAFDSLEEGKAFVSHG